MKKNAGFFLLAAAVLLSLQTAVHASDIDQDIKSLRENLRENLKEWQKQGKKEKPEEKTEVWVTVDYKHNYAVSDSYADGGSKEHSEERTFRVEVNAEINSERLNRWPDSFQIDLKIPSRNKNKKIISANSSATYHFSERSWDPCIKGGYRNEHVANWSGTDVIKGLSFSFYLDEESKPVVENAVFLMALLQFPTVAIHERA